jgi:hypothetical protein
MQTIRTIGLDIAKSIFQVHGVDAAGNVIVRRKLKRATFCHFFTSYHCASLASKPAPHPIIYDIHAPLGAAEPVLCTL